MHHGLDRLGMDRRVLGEHQPVQAVARHRLAARADQRRQQRVLARPEVQRRLVAADDARRSVPPQAAAAHAAGGVLPAHQRAQPRLELVQVEGLGQIVVGTGVEARDPVADRAPGRQHEHRRVIAAAAQPRQHGEAVDAGDRQVEHDHVEHRPLQHAQRVQAVVALGALVPAARHRARQRQRQVGIVFDEQELHRATMRSARPGVHSRKPRAMTKAERQLGARWPPDSR